METDGLGHVESVFPSDVSVISILRVDKLCYGHFICCVIQYYFQGG